MSLVLHWGHLEPLILFDYVFLNRIKPLFSAEPAEHEDISSYQSYRMSISALVHGSSRQNVIFLSEVNPRILLGRRAASGDQDLHRGQSYGR